MSLPPSPLLHTTTHTLAQERAQSAQLEPRLSTMCSHFPRGGLFATEQVSLLHLLKNLTLKLIKRPQRRHSTTFSSKSRIFYIYDISLVTKPHVQTQTSREGIS